ncbi:MULTISPECIES: ATP synthase subunit I [unclassified Acinetobacter]|uniref:ATP synthase subunit I n=1 Tax=unclassified Acinetobacter TaxID=196816 RepID=UPI0035B8FE00
MSHANRGGQQTARLVDARLAKALTLLQALMIPIAAILAWLVQDNVAAKSAALGAGLYWLASAYFAWQSFRTSGARASQYVLNNMYKGMTGKFVIVIVGLILILTQVKPINMLAVLAGLMLVQAMAWLAPFWLHKYSKA